MRIHLRPKAALRSLAVLAAVGLSAVSLTACSPGGGGGSAGSATSGTVNWWGWTPEIATAKAYIAEFNKKYPKITVKYKQITIANYLAAMRPALASSKGPDVFSVQPGAYVQQFGGFAEDLTPVVKKSLGSDWKSKVAPIGVSGLTKGNKLVGLSLGSTFAGMLWINQGLFDKYGVKPPTTLDEWAKACATFRSHGQGCFVQGASQEGFDQDTLQSIANSVQPGLWTKASKGEAKWNDPGIVKTFDIWHQLFTKNIMQPGAIGYAQYPDANNNFLTGKYAMVMMGTWYMQYATKAGLTAALGAAGVSNAKPFPIQPLAFPDVAGAGNTSEMYGDSDSGLAVATKSQHRAAAETFVSWLTTSQDGQQTVADVLNDIPAVKGLTPNFSKIEMVDKAKQQQPITDLIAKTGTVNEPREALLSSDVQNGSGGILAAATAVASGKETPQAAADALQKAAEASGQTFK
jgi:ABC-type glycerol-3-phosphate transport system substrate-binding protein